MLSRKPGEAIKIGDDVEIHVLSVRGKVVRIGIEAPDDVPIKRDDMKQDEPDKAER